MRLRWSTRSVTRSRALSLPCRGVSAQLLLDLFSMDGELPVDLPLFPTSSGHTTSKAAVVASFRAWLSAPGLPLDNLPTGARSFRAAGAQLLAKEGIDTDAIMVAARWTSLAVLKHVREAPLKALTQRYGNQFAGGVRSTLPLDVVSSLEGRLGAVEALLDTGSTSASSTAKAHCSSAAALLLRLMRGSWSTMHLGLYMGCALLSWMSLAFGGRCADGGLPTLVTCATLCLLARPKGSRDALSLHLTPPIRPRHLHPVSEVKRLGLAVMPLPTFAERL